MNLTLPHLVVAALVVLCMSNFSTANEGAKRIKGTSALIDAPQGDWTATPHPFVAGQAGTTWKRAEGAMELTVIVFPVRHKGTASSLLRQAVDTTIRHIPGASFGMTSQRDVSMLGRSGSEARLDLSFKEGRAKGFARLLRVSDSQWGLAWGFSREGRSRDEGLVIDRLVQSFRTDDPALFSMRFDEHPTFGANVAHVPGEEPMTREHVIATQFLIEASQQERFPLAVRPLLRSALLEDVRKKEPKWRDAFRAASKSIREAAPKGRTQRESSFRKWGMAVWAGYIVRSAKHDAVGMKVTTIWEKLREPVASFDSSHLRMSDYAAMAEMASFLASIALDTGVPIPDAMQPALKKMISDRWSELHKVVAVVPPTTDGDSAKKPAPPQSPTPAQEAAKAETVGLQDADKQWAEVRNAWDRALPAGKFAFRKALLKHGAAGDAERAAVEALSNAVELKRWFEARAASRSATGPTDDPIKARMSTNEAVLRQMFRLTPLDRDALIASLKVSGTKGWHFGW